MKVQYYFYELRDKGVFDVLNETFVFAARMVVREIIPAFKTAIVVPAHQFSLWGLNYRADRAAVAAAKLIFHGLGLSGIFQWKGIADERLRSP